MGRMVFDTCSECGGQCRINTDTQLCQQCASDRRLLASGKIPSPEAIRFQCAMIQAGQTGNPNIDYGRWTEEKRQSRGERVEYVQYPQVCVDSLDEEEDDER